jgi:hypothetical protein
MTMRSQSGSFSLNIAEDYTNGSSKAMIEALDDLAGQPSELFDKLLAFTSDVLGRQAVEQHRYKADTSRRFNGATHTYRERRD